MCPILFVENKTTCTLFVKLIGSYTNKGKHTSCANIMYTLHTVEPKPYQLKVLSINCCANNFSKKSKNLNCK